jgi:hypothetical protein
VVELNAADAMDAYGGGNEGAARWEGSGCRRAVWAARAGLADDEWERKDGALPGSNPVHLACKASALPFEIHPVDAERDQLLLFE